MSAIDKYGRSHWQKGKARSMRRGYPIMSYVGANGSGKTAAAVWDSLPSLDAGRTVLSTVRLLDFRTPRVCVDVNCVSEDHDTHAQAHPSFVSLTEWRQLLDAEHCDVVMDEVTGVASSRESSGMPAAVANLLVQLRRRDVVLRWTAPSWARADKIIRECSQAVTVCAGSFAVADEDDRDGEDRAWRRRRCFKWRTYDAGDFEEWTQGQRDTRQVWCKERFWGPGSLVFSAYDTLDSVASIGHVLDSGRCADCGGRRSAPTCSCADHTERRARARAAARSEPEAGTRVAGKPQASTPDPVPTRRLAVAGSTLRPVEVDSSSVLM